MHALITLFLCGLWVPVWVLASRRDAWRCQTCGTPSVIKQDNLGLLVFLLVLVIIAAVASTSFYLSER